MVDRFANSDDFYVFVTFASEPRARTKIVKVPLLVARSRVDANNNFDEILLFELLGRILRRMPAGDRLSGSCLLAFAGQATLAHILAWEKEPRKMGFYLCYLRPPLHLTFSSEKGERTDPSGRNARKIQR